MHSLSHVNNTPLSYYFAPHKPGMIIQQVAAGDGALDTNGTIETGQPTSMSHGERMGRLCSSQGGSSVYRLRLTTGATSTSLL